MAMMLWNDGCQLCMPAQAPSHNKVHVPALTQILDPLVAALAWSGQNHLPVPGLELSPGALGPQQLPEQLQPWPSFCSRCRPPKPPAHHPQRLTGLRQNEVAPHAWGRDVTPAAPRCRSPWG